LSRMEINYPLFTDKFLVHKCLVSVGIFDRRPGWRAGICRAELVLPA
jgi:hypothetical protein